MIWFRIAAVGKEKVGRRFVGTCTMYIKKAEFRTSDPASVSRVSSTVKKGEAEKFGKLTAERVSQALNDPKRWGLKTRVEPIEE